MLLEPFRLRNDALLLPMVMKFIYPRLHKLERDAAA